jgi:DNA-binding transcriptional regulator YiaG
MTPDELEGIMVNMGLSPIDLADTLGITRGAVMHWLDGRRAVPEIAARLIRMFNEDHSDVEYYISFKSN